MSATVPATTSAPRAAAGGSARKTATARRTTVTLSRESLEIVERFKTANGTSTSAAIDQIIQRSEPQPSQLIEYHGFLVKSLPPENPEGTVKFTVEDLKDLEDKMDREYVDRFLFQKSSVPRPGLANGLES